MKNLAKKQDGYILAYVLVIVLVVGIVAVAAYTTAVKNYASQKAAWEYTRAKYDAEGAMERFVAELQIEMVDAAEAVYTGFSNKPGAEVVQALQEEISAAITYTIVPGIKEAGYEISVSGEDQLENEDYGFVAYQNVGDEEDAIPDLIRGYFPLEVTACISNDKISVEAVVNVIFNATAEKVVDPNPVITWEYTVTGASFEYSSYSVSTVANTGDAEERGESS